MKKFMFLLLTIFAFQASAQEFHFIPRIGLNLAKAGWSVRPGMNVGLAGEFMITPNFAIEPGVYYSMQGSRHKEDGVTGKMKLDYINIPIYAKAYLYEGFYAFLGPQFGFNVKAKTDDFLYSTLPTFQNNRASEDIKDFVHTFDFSLGVGLGYAFDMGLLISANYNIGLTHIFKQDEADANTVFDNTYRNNVFQLNVGWRF